MAACVPQDKEKWLLIAARGPDRDSGFRWVQSHPDRCHLPTFILKVDGTKQASFSRRVL